MKKQKIAEKLTTLALLLTAASTAHAATTVGILQTFDVPGATNTSAVGINNTGQVAGNYTDATGNAHGYVYANGVYTTFSVPGATNTYVMGINASGQVAGYYTDGAGDHGFLKTGGSFATFNAPGAVITRGYALNDGGQVAGFSQTASQQSVSGSSSFVYSAGVLKPLLLSNYADVAYDINELGQASGYYFDSAQNLIGFVRNADNGFGVDVRVPNGTSVYGTRAYGLNNSGQVIGYYSTTSAQTDAHGFLYSSGTYLTLDAPGATKTYPWRINDSGEVAGYYYDAAGLHHSFIFNDGTLYPFDGLNGTKSIAYGINASGQVAGYYYDAAGTFHGYLATLVPIPAAVWLFASALGGLGVFRRVTR